MKLNVRHSGLKYQKKKKTALVLFIVALDVLYTRWSVVDQRSRTWREHSWRSYREDVLIFGGTVIDGYQRFRSMRLSGLGESCIITIEDYRLLSTLLQARICRARFTNVEMWRTMRYTREWLVASIRGNWTAGFYAFAGNSKRQCLLQYLTYKTILLPRLCSLNYSLVAINLHKNLEQSGNMSWTLFIEWNETLRKLA